MGDNNSLTYLGFAAIGGIFFFIMGYVLRKYTAKMKIKRAEDKAKTIINESKLEAEKRKREALIEVKDISLKMRAEFENESRDRRQELLVMEKRLMQKEGNIDKKVGLIEQRETEIKNGETKIRTQSEEINKKKEALDRMVQEEKDRLEKLSGLSREQAKNVLIQKMKDEALKDAALEIKKIQEETKDKADREARKIVGLAIQKCAVDHTVETTVSVVNLPSEEMKELTR